MNKKFKVIIKDNPCFKYVVEDYPFYEGIYFHSVDYHYMNLLHAHYLISKQASMDDSEFIMKIKFRLKKAINQRFFIIENSLNFKFRFRKKLSFGTCHYTNLNFIAKKLLTKRFHHKDYSIMKVVPHKVWTIKLKTHDPYTLYNRDNLTLEEMDIKFEI